MGLIWGGLGLVVLFGLVILVVCLAGWVVGGLVWWFVCFRSGFVLVVLRVACVCCLVWCFVGLDYLWFLFCWFVYVFIVLFVSVWCGVLVGPSALVWVWLFLVGVAFGALATWRCFGWCGCCFGWVFGCVLLYLY